jgi:hypothetical protein
MLATLASCATSYKSAVSATYMGNNTYAIDGSGNDKTSQRLLSEYTIRKAYRVCADKHNSGFVVVSGNQASNMSVVSVGYSIIPVSRPESKTVVECKGAIDPVLAQQYGHMEE